MAAGRREVWHRWYVTPEWNLCCDKFQTEDTKAPGVEMKVGCNIDQTCSPHPCLTPLISHACVNEHGSRNLTVFVSDPYLCSLYRYLYNAYIAKSLNYFLQPLVPYPCQDLRAITMHI